MVNTPLGRGRGRPAKHDSISYGSIKGQGHVALKVRNSSIFNIYLVRYFQGSCQRPAEKTISKFDLAGFLTSVLLFVSRDFELGRTWLPGVDRQSRTGLIFLELLQVWPDQFQTAGTVNYYRPDALPVNKTTM